MPSLIVALVFLVIASGSGAYALRDLAFHEPDDPSPIPAWFHLAAALVAVWGAASSVAPLLQP